jgi:hypothetical protein
MRHSLSLVPLVAEVPVRPPASLCSRAEEALVEGRVGRRGCVDASVDVADGGGQYSAINVSSASCVTLSSKFVPRTLLSLNEIGFTPPLAVVAHFPGLAKLSEDECDSERDSRRSAVGECREGGRERDVVV